MERKQFHLVIFVLQTIRVIRGITVKVTHLATQTFLSQGCKWNFAGLQRRWQVKVCGPWSNPSGPICF